jgi:LPXTG-motif cell wall-anchored protein
MLVSLNAGLPAGKYTVHWTTLALDGDSLSDTFAFSVAAPTSAAKPATAAPRLPKTGGMPFEILVLGGFALAASGMALRRRAI